DDFVVAFNGGHPNGCGLQCFTGPRDQVSGAVTMVFLSPGFNDGKEVVLPILGWTLPADVYGRATDSRSRAGNGSRNFRNGDGHNGLYGVRHTGISGVASRHNVANFVFTGNGWGGEFG